MSNSLYKCPICGGPSNYSSINYQPKPCLHCCATLKLKPAEHGENHGTTLFDGGKDNETTTPAPTPWEIKEGYWYEQYQLMRERYNRQIGENSKQAERIRKLEEQLKAKQGESRELYAMLGHIVDWSPELPFYMKDEYKTLFRNALAAARELLSKCSVKEGKPKQGPIENIIDGLHNQSADLSTEELASELKEDGIDLDGLKKRVSRLIAEAKRQKEGK